MINKKTARVNTPSRNSTTSPKLRPQRPRKPAQLAPSRHVLDIGKAISLELTLAMYEITPNAAAIELIGRDE